MYGSTLGLKHTSPRSNRNILVHTRQNHMLLYVLPPLHSLFCCFICEIERRFTYFVLSLLPLLRAKRVKVQEWTKLPLLLCCCWVRSRWSFRELRAVIHISPCIGPFLDWYKPAVPLDMDQFFNPCIELGWPSFNWEKKFWNWVCNCLKSWITKSVLTGWYDWYILGSTASIY